MGDYVKLFDKNNQYQGTYAVAVVATWDDLDDYILRCNGEKDGIDCEVAVQIIERAGKPYVAARKTPHIEGCSCAKLRNELIVSSLSPTGEKFHIDKFLTSIDAKKISKKSKAAVADGDNAILVTEDPEEQVKNVIQATRAPRTVKDLLSVLNMLPLSATYGDKQLSVKDLIVDQRTILHYKNKGVIGHKLVVAERPGTLPRFIPKENTIFLRDAYGKEDSSRRITYELIMNSSELFRELLNEIKGDGKTEFRVAIWGNWAVDERASGDYNRNVESLHRIDKNTFLTHITNKKQVYIYRDYLDPFE